MVAAPAAIAHAVPKFQKRGDLQDSDPVGTVVDSGPQGLADDLEVRLRLLVGELLKPHQIFEPVCGHLHTSDLMRATLIYAMNAR